MANEEHLAILRQDVETWNRWRRTKPNVRPNLSGANLGGADLSRANLFDTNLSQANLSRADLRWSDLRGANLGGADLSRADLRWGDLTRSELSQANLNYTVMSSTNLSELDLRQVKGLDRVRHKGPSVVSISTLFKSQGEIPEIFLRGCGVPDSLIEYLPSLIGAMQPIQFYSCFISYSTKDQDFAQRLYERMQSHHLRVWFAPEELKAGRKIHEEIDQAIRVYDKLIVVLSEHSIASEWVKTEIYNARQAEITQQKRKLFPIRLVDMDVIKAWRYFDADTGKDLGRELREYYIPDFSNWKDHDSFEREFKRLLDALKSEEKPPAR